MVCLLQKFKQPILFIFNTDLHASNSFNYGVDFLIRRLWRNDDSQIIDHITIHTSRTSLNPSLFVYSMTEEI